MKKILLRAAALAVLILGMWTMPAMAAEIVASGNCGAQGDNLTWTLDPDWNLIICGSGNMADYAQGRPSPWDSYRSRIKSLSLPDGLKNIGNRAFWGCTAIEGDLKIPNSVMEIGDFAFTMCGGLSGNLNIPEKVTSIGVHAFYYCDGFSGDLIIPEGVTYVGDTAFYMCTGFDGKLFIPKSLAVINRGTFWGCTGLKGSLVLHSGITEIKGQAFESCRNLKGPVFVSPNINELGYGAFLRCSGLEKFYFYGDAPTVESLNGIKMPTFDEGVTLCYVEGKNGWTTPTWNGYKTETWVPDAGIEVEGMNIPEDEYWIILHNSNGNPVEGATVTWNGIKKETNADGIASFKYDLNETANISFELEGFDKRIIENYIPLPKGYEIFRWHGKEESELALQSAIYTYASEPDKKEDVLSGTKRLVILTGIDELEDYFSLDCEAVEKDKAIKYELYQGNTIMATSNTGLFEQLKISNFSVNGNVTVKVYDSADQFAVTTLNIFFVEDDKLAKYKNVDFGMGKECVFVIPENVPFFGGFKAKFDLPINAAPIVYLEGDTLRLGVNSDPDSRREFVDDTKKLISRFDKMKDLLAKGKMDKDFKDEFAKLAACDPGEVPLFGDIDVNRIIYGEAKYDPNAETKMTIYAGIMADSEKEMNGPVIWLGPVPVSFMMDLETELKTIGQFVYNFDTKKMQGQGIDLGGKVEVEPFGGFGLYKLVNIGLYGNGSAALDSNIFPARLESVILRGHFGLKAYLLFMEKEKKFREGAYQLYPESSTNARMRMEVPLFDDGEYIYADTSYLSNESSWLGGNGMMLLDLEQTNIQELQTSTYRNMQPQIVSLGDNLVMVWTGADTSREAYNLTQLKYSVHNGIGWSEPQAVDSNETADYLHDVYSDGENLWVVYQESATAFDAEPSMEEAAADMQIVAAKFDTTTGRFADHTVLSNEGGYESIPAITIVDGKPYAVWTSNSDTTDLFGQNDTNEIHYAEYDGEWSAAQVLASGLGPVADLGTGDLEGKASIAYVSSADTSLETDDDNILYTVDFAGTAKEVSEGIVSSLKFAELPGESKSSLVWYDNGSLKTLQNGAAKTVIENGMAYAAGFDVLSDRIIFNHATDGASDVFASIYEDGAYQEPVRMTYQDSYIQSYSFVEHGSKAFAALVQTDVTITEDAVEDDCTLSFLTFEGVTDASLESAAYDDADLVAGEDLPVEVILKNTGDTLIKKVQLTVMDENNEVCTSVTETVDLASHEEVTLTVDLPIGNTIHKQVYTVKATAENDANADNNSWQILVGDEMLSVSGEMIRSGSNVKAIVKVLNDGHETTGGTLTISSVSDGTVLIEKELTELAAGESHLLILDGEYLLNGKESDVLQLAVETTAGNNYSANRMQQMYISRAIVEEETVENTLNISEVDGNVIGVEISNTEDVDVAAAVYDAEGKMLAYEISTDIRSNIYNYEAFVMDLEDLTEGQTVKAFMLKTETREPLCEAAEYVVK